MTSRSAVAAELIRCGRWLDAAIVRSEGDTDAPTVARAVLDGEAQLWAGERYALVTQLVLADEPYVMVWLAGGSMRELLAATPTIEAWARMQGARSARVNGRVGWTRVLRPLGYREVPGGQLWKALV